MKRALCAVCCGAAMAALALADEPWKGKAYQQWDMKDVQRVLNDSPWVRVVHVNANWRKAGANGVPLDQGGTSPGNYGAQGASDSGGRANAGATTGSSSYGIPGGGGPTNANSGSLAQNSAILNSAKTPETTFVLRWFSSAAIRHALARAQVLSGGLSEADAEKALGDEPTEFEVTIAGPDMTPFLKAEEKDLAAKAFLQPKKEGNRVAASRVVIQRLPNSKAEDPRSISAVVYYFAKKSANGEPAVGPGAKNVEFVCEAGAATIKASFELAKMADSKGLDW